MIRVAAVGDVHYDRHPREDFQAYFRQLPDRADLLLIAGDITQSGNIEEARAFAHDLSGLPIPIVAVLGNHDFHQDMQQDIQNMFRDNGIMALEGESAVFQIRDRSVGVVGMKGFGGGFFGACITEFGERETKQFASHGRHQAEILQARLRELDTDYRFALLHFSPIEETLLGEKREIYPFLGSYLLGEAIDSVGADAAFHGHAHHGAERGVTPGGVPVRNVALPVIRHAYNVYRFEAPTRSHQEQVSQPSPP